MSYVNSKWKGIAKGHTAFCILGGPSVKLVKDLGTIISNNFTVTVNHNIKLYPNVDLYVTGDNSIAREYLEDKSFFIHKFTGGKLLQNQAVFNYEQTPQWVEGKRSLLLQNPNLIKVIGCNTFPSYNYSFSTGQLYHLYGEEYCKQIPNTHLCLEYRNQQGESWPMLSPELPESITTYGSNPKKLYPGGNISGVMFQLLYYMGFDKVIVVGYGDNGTSAGYTSNTKFIWSNEEIHAMVVHNTIWGDRLKALHGSEICREYVDFKTATYQELNNTPDKKNILINKLIKL